MLFGKQTLISLIKHDDDTLLGGIPVKFIGNYFVMFYTKHLALEFIGIYIQKHQALRFIGKFH